MNTVFLDANVIFSAAYSDIGGSAYVFQLAKKSRLTLYSSRLAIKEAERNLRKKADAQKVLKANLPIKIVNPSQFIEKHL